MFVIADWNSALMIVINGEEDDHLEMLEGGVMRQLLDDKWKTFAKVRLPTINMQEHSSHKLTKSYQQFFFKAHWPACTKTDLH